MLSIVSKKHLQAAVAALWLLVFLGLLSALGDQPDLVTDPAIVASTVQVNAAGAEATDTPNASDEAVTVTFNFRFAPWKDVLDWIAQQADLSLLLDAPPPGTFNYTDNRPHTPTQAIDIVNSVLLIQGYTLVQRERMLILVNLEDGVPPELLPQVSPEDLDQRGEFELLRCLFQLDVVTPEEAEQQISKLLGPQGTIVVIPKAKQLLVTETGGKLRTIRAVIQSLDDPDAAGPDKLHSFDLRLATAEEVLVVARKLLDLPDDASAAEDGSIHIAADAMGTKLFVTGNPEKIALVERIVQELDGVGGLKYRDVNIVETPQLEVHRVSGADPSAVLRVLQTLLAELADVRLEMDPQTGNLVALARPSDHATIRATIAQMQGNGWQIAVFRLRTVDPRLAVSSIDKLFGGGTEENNSTGPKVHVDLTARQLVVRGTAAQIAEIRALLAKLGETGEPGMASGYAQTGKVRMLPITGYEAQAALEQIERVWSVMRDNRLHLLRPTAPIQTLRLGRRSATDQGAHGKPLSTQISPPASAPVARETNSRGAEDTSPAQQPSAGTGTGKKQAKAVGTKQTRGISGVRVAMRQSSDNGTDRELTEDSAASITGPTAEAGRLADIIIAPGPGGIMIASDDPEALDLLGALFRTLSDRAMIGGRGFSVVYLKYARAEVAADLLARALGSDGVQPDRILSEAASAVPGEVVSGLVRSVNVNILGGEDTSGTVTTSGPVDIVADLRLNALIVHAEANDLNLIQQLLEVIDQESGPEEVLTVAPPRLIPVLYTTAEEIAEIVRDVYLNRISSTPVPAPPQSPTNRVALQRGARTGRVASVNAGRSSRGGETGMTIGVDRRSNSLVVSAPEPLFQEVKALVAQLDQVELSQTVQVVTLKRANAALVNRALVEHFGNQVETVTAHRPARIGRDSGYRQQIGSRQEAVRQPPPLEQIRGQIQSNDAFNAVPRAVVPRGGGNLGRGTDGGGN